MNVEPLASEKFVGMLTDAQASLYGYILSLIPDPDQAGEVLQETNLALWRTADRFQEGTDFLAWTCSVAYYQVLRHRKKQQRDRLRFDDEMLKTLADRGAALLIGDRQIALRRCLARLSSADRELLKQRYSGTTPIELAQSRRVPVKRLYQSLYRLRIGLLECIHRTLAAEGNR